MFTIIPAAGSGTRLFGAGASSSKALCPAFSSTAIRLPSLLECALRALARCNDSGVVVIAARQGDEEHFQELATVAAPDLQCVVVTGGATRQESVWRALLKIKELADSEIIGSLIGGSLAEQLVTVHDGARPFALPELFERVRVAGKEFGAAIPGIPLKPSIKRVDERGFVTGTIKRAQVVEVQTPQCFRFSLLESAHQQAAAEGFEGTDDSELVERSGAVVKVVPGDECNIKITTPLDLAFVRVIVEDNLFKKKYEHLL